MCFRNELHYGGKWINLSKQEENGDKYCEMNGWISKSDASFKTAVDKTKIRNCQFLLSSSSGKTFNVGLRILISLMCSFVRSYDVYHWSSLCTAEKITRRYHWLFPPDYQRSGSFVVGFLVRNEVTVNETWIIHFEP